MRFKGAHVVKDMVLTCIRWYMARPLSYRHVEALMRECGVSVDHSTINEVRSQLEEAYHPRKRPVWVSWRMDETSIKDMPWLLWARGERPSPTDRSRRAGERVNQRLAARVFNR